MDTTETTEITPEPTPDLVLTQEAKSFLHTAGRWANFLGIMGFIFTGLIVLAALFAGRFISRLSQLQLAGAHSNIMASMGNFIRIIYLLLSVFYFFFSYYLYQFGMGIKRGTFFSDNIQVTKALENLKSFFKLWGISTIVMIVLYILIIIGAIIAVIGTAAMNR